MISTEPIPLDNGAYTPLFDGPHNEDRDKFKDDTIHFDFDSSIIKSSEESKLQDLANYFKDNDPLRGPHYRRQLRRARHGKIQSLPG